MGIIRTLKNIFSHNIQCKQDIDNELVYLFPSNSRNIKIGCNILVKDGFCAVFVVKDRVTDVLKEGKYRIDWQALPLSARRLRVDKGDGNVKRFKADVYFVNMNRFNEFVFSSNQPFLYKTENFGKVKANSYGICSFQIVSPELLLSILLSDRAFINSKLAKKYVAYYIGNEVNQRIEKSKINFNEILQSPKSLNAYLNECMKESLIDIGIKLDNIKLNCIECLSKKQQERINEYLSYQNEFICTSDNILEKKSVTVNIEREVNLQANSGENDMLSSQINSSFVICPNCHCKASGNFCNNCGTKLN